MTETPLETVLKPPREPIETYGPWAQEAQVERVAQMILDATAAAQQAILTATQQAVEKITQTAADALTAIPAALSTPAPQGLTPDEIVTAFERMSEQSGGYPDQYGYGQQSIPLDLTVDQLVDQYGNDIAPNWAAPGEEVEVEVPDVERPTSVGIGIGQQMVPGVPRLDLPGH